MLRAMWALDNCHRASLFPYHPAGFRGMPRPGYVYVAQGLCVLGLGCNACRAWHGMALIHVLVPITRCGAWHGLGHERGGEASGAVLIVRLGFLRAATLGYSHGSVRTSLLS